MPPILAKVLPIAMPTPRDSVGKDSEPIVSTALNIWKIKKKSATVIETI